MDRREHDERNLDETIEESFPASDPPGNTVETGARLAADDLVPEVRDNQAESRYELVKDGQLAFLAYERRPDSIAFIHMEVPPALRGQQIGDALAKAGLGAARLAGVRIIAVCPFVRAYMRRHRHPGEAPR